MNEITKIFAKARGGDHSAASELLHLVYEELKQMAAVQARHQPPGSTLNTTALVHEAWLRLAPKNQMPVWNCRGHFFAAAAEAMRRVLIDAARRRNADKRGGGRQRVEFEAVQPIPLSDDRLLMLNDALERLQLDKPDVVQLVKLRFFIGLKNDEAADLLGISPRTAKNWWAYAKAWLHAEIGED
jgi:RNA polymerase sigma factor (TIGR02999 family)